MLENLVWTFSTCEDLELTGASDRNPKAVNDIYVTKISQAEKIPNTRTVDVSV